MTKKADIGKNAKVSIRWKVNSFDYSHEEESAIISEFAEKYGIAKSAITVVPQFIDTDTEDGGNTFGGETIENIEDPQFQKGLFKKYFDLKKKEESESIEEIDFDQIMEIDDLINSFIDYNVYESHKKYFIKWIKWDNFMSYGPNNYIDFRTLNGLILLTSDPANQGGKTTFCLDLFRFLLFGKVASRESQWDLSKAFNRYLPESTEVNVEGCVCIDGTDYVIKRTLSRPALNRRTDKSKVTQKISYYKVINDEYVDLEDTDDTENMSSSSVKETNKVIKEAIGNEKDFDLMICVSQDNLKSLISLKDTERGRLMARWIGLLPIEEKDKLSRDYYNKSVQPKLLLSRYNKEEVKEDIKTREEAVKEAKKAQEKAEKDSKASDKKIKEYQKKRDELIQSKLKISENIQDKDVNTVKEENERLIEEGKKKKNERDDFKKRFDEIGEVEFNEEKYKELSDEERAADVKLNTLRNSITSLKADIEALKKGEFCPTCGAKLKDVDNSAKVAEKEKQINNTIEEGKKLKKEHDEMKANLDKLAENKKLHDERNKLDLSIQKREVDMDNLRAKIRENKAFLEEIKKNEEAIAHNNKVNAEINVVDTTISVERGVYDGYIRTIAEKKHEVEWNNAEIEKDKKIIETINTEEKTVKNWKLYLEMVGKNGVSKMVLRNALPLINGELKHLLSDVCDFDVEVSIDDHNDVVFYLIHDGVKSNLASGSGFEQTVSSLALRSVLSKISSFSKPSFVVFDEILGGVAAENYENVKKLYDKLRDTVPTILQICHIKDVADWHDRSLLVTKENNISKISID